MNVNDYRPAGGGIVTTSSPPTQPALPPPPRGDGGVASDVRAQTVRHLALQSAIAYAGAGLAVTVGQFWQAVDAFEDYIRTGKHL